MKRLPYATGTALGYRTGQPRVPLRWVLLRDPARPRDAQALLRTTPARLGLFSWLVLVAHRLQRQRTWRPRRAAWYPKTRPTCADVLACVRHVLWTGALPFSLSPPETDIRKCPPPPTQSLDTLCYTA